MKIIAVIPTRKGSTRLPNKNTKLFANSNLLTIVINKLKKVNGLYKIIVSSNDEESLRIASELNVVCHRRDDKYCTPECSGDIWVSELARVVLNEGGEYIMFCHCVCPLIKAESYNALVEQYILKNMECISFGIKYKHHMWYNGKPLNYDFDKPLPLSQNLPDYFTICWGGVITKCQRLIDESSILTLNTVFLEVDQIEGIDIDTEDEFELAEYFYKKYFLTN